MSRPAMAALAHPVALGAAALIVVNDMLLTGSAPGWLTGKLSDIGWLVVAPVVFASVFELARFSRPRALGLSTAVGLYVLLQVWPPLGAWLSPSHVADLEDLLVLPAVLGAVVAWRGASTPRAWALPALVAVLVADSWESPEDRSAPCTATERWPADRPLRFSLAESNTPVDTDTFRRAVRLTAGGEDVPFILADDYGTAVVCARDGLRDGIEYTWELGPWDEASGNTYALRHDALPTVVFIAEGDGIAIADAEACLREDELWRFEPDGCAGGTLDDTGADSGADSGG